MIMGSFFSLLLSKCHYSALFFKSKNSESNNNWFNIHSKFSQASSWHATLHTEFLKDICLFLSSFTTWTEVFSCIYVVVQFYPWFKFSFPLLLGMVMYDNEFETKENRIEPQDIHVPLKEQLTSIILQKVWTQESFHK